MAVMAGKEICDGGDEIWIGACLECAIGDRILFERGGPLASIPRVAAGSPFYEEIPASDSSQIPPQFLCNSCPVPAYFLRPNQPLLCCSDIFRVCDTPSRGNAPEFR